jgi:divalent metal cation (Fe/Co/Zn/Cd) transporter
VGSLRELSDGGVPPHVHAALLGALNPLLAPGAPGAPRIHAISGLRARRAGARAFVELDARVDAGLPVREAAALEAEIAALLRAKRREVSDVRVRFVPNGETGDVAPRQGRGE